MSTRALVPIRGAVLAGLLTAAPVFTPLGAQEPGVIRGTVRAAADSAPVAGAVVVAPAVPGRPATTTTPSGAFTLRVPAGPARLVAAAIGFAPETLEVGAGAAAVAFLLAPAPVTLDPVAVAAERAYSAASSGAVRALDIRLRPRESSQELLRLVPGLVIAQHAGGGKAEQIFLRGFDADHGTDVAISVDGSPVNLVSHAHGQGYADLHFLIPELVDHVDVRKGPYDPRDGDFATAGAVTLRTRDRVDGAEVTTRAGSFGTARTLALVPFGDSERAGGYLAAAGQLTRGPFERSQDHRRYNLFGKWTAPLGRGAELVTSASSFAARWDASGQIPERAVQAGVIGRFGSIDPTEGGTTARHEVAVGLRSRGQATAWDVRAYAVRYRLRLYSNFTFFLNDSVNGDGIEQLDERYVVGASTSYQRPTPILSRFAVTSAGLGVRSDFADVGLFRHVRRARLDTVSTADVSQQHVFVWAREEVALSERVRLDIGLRGDAFRFGVGQRAVVHGIVSPKASVAARVGEGTTFFVNTGTGFHSNDARDVLSTGPADRVLPRALGAEAGVRHAWAAGTLAASAWALDLESELVYVGDEGVTEPSGCTRRVGLDFEARLRIAPWLWADADLSLARGQFRDAPPGADRIPLGPTLTSTGGLTVRDAGRVGGGLRYRLIGARPADEEGRITAPGAAVWELVARYRAARFDAVLAVDNLFDAQWNEAQFASTSRLRDEATGVTELHFTPGVPRSIQLGVEYRF